MVVKNEQNIFNLYLTHDEMNVIRHALNKLKFEEDSSHLQTLKNIKEKIVENFDNVLNKKEITMTDCKTENEYNKVNMFSGN